MSEPEFKEVWILWNTDMDGSSQSPRLSAENEAEARAYAHKKGAYEKDMPISSETAIQVGDSWWITVRKGWNFFGPGIFYVPPRVDLQENDLLRYQAFLKLTPEEMKAMQEVR
ncbi:hypothetical protein LCGC14_0236230 [marine sediment metagenome]|uniref:Uncharacterized protein n=1 Tax=marine sediment metagenome TaxID=412755 RepID=A0A0F9UQM3_9ZZZZ